MKETRPGLGRSPEYSLRSLAVRFVGLVETSGKAARIACACDFSVVSLPGYWSSLLWGLLSRLPRFLNALNFLKNLKNRQATQATRTRTRNATHKCCYDVTGISKIVIGPPYDASILHLMERTITPENIFFTITAEIHARSLVKFYCQYADRHMNLKFMRRVSKRERSIRQFVIVKNKLKSVFNASVLLLTMNFVITLSK